MRDSWREVPGSWVGSLGPGAICMFVIKKKKKLTGRAVLNNAAGAAMPSRRVSPGYKGKPGWGAGVAGSSPSRPAAVARLDERA